ncbi:DUF5977 domain-containing protein [Flavobacterium sp. FlaQc-48]|uniref:DUF5977 domain-containing protein n=1 Tax=Flavobacterium sp. FlaQc-48 TaxID=3374181 RepID=UPI0037568D28
MKKIVLFFTYLFLGTIYCIAQDIPNIMPPSPNAASLGKYGQVPVGLFTGTPQVDIPLYSFATGKIVVPISLNYSSNGIRVDEMASDVGLSWALIAGGAITRTIMDDADENQTAAVPNFSDYTAETLTYLQNATNGEDGYDTANDMYSFNFNGFSGKFYLNENKIPVLINPSPLKIERTPLGPYAFKITDPSGIIYWFGSSASTEKIMYRTKLSGHNTWTGEEPSSWYISKIENPNSGDTVTFNYSVSNYSYDAGLSQSVARSKSSSGSYSGQNLVISESRVLGVILNSITSDSGKVTFVYAARDVVSNTKKIESIEIEDIHQKSIKKFILGYDLVTSSLETEYRNPHITYEPQYGKRLFLTSITEINDGISKPAYQLAYYDYDKIPPRFSYAQDYWGYFNGEQSNAYLVSDDDYYYSGSKFSPSTLKNIFGNVGGNKKPNGLYSKNGLLKTITYPTGGFNELFYEPHSYFGKKQIYPSKKQVAINISNTADQFSQSQTVISEIIPFSQEKVPLYFSAGTVRCWESSWPSHHIKATLTVEVAENGSDVFTTPANGTGIYVVIPNGDKVYDISSSVVAAPTIVQHYIDLVEGNKYRFKVSVPFECIRGDFSTSFYDSAYTSIDANIEVGGQRLSKMITTDNENKKEIKEYYYGNLSCLSCSSGVIEPPVPSITLKTYHDWTGSTWSGDPSYALTATDILTLSSSTLCPLYTKQNSHIGYTSVVESIGENFSAGGIMHKFMNTPVEIAQPLRGLYVPGTAFNTTFGTGNEIETQYFSKNRNSYITTKKIVNSYELNPVLNKERFGYSINQRDLYSGGSWSIIDKIKGYDITRYIIRSQWHYIKESTEEIYDLNGLNPIKTKTNFSYHNPAHLQLTSQTTINSSQETLETKYYYAPDLEMASQPYITDLKTSNIIIPALKIQAFKGGAKISDQLIIYDKSQETSNLLLPKEVFVNKGIEEINLSLDKKITYNQYDDRGNILQYTIEGGTPVAIIWGYNKTQPIAKIENMSYASIPSGTITSLQSRSDADNDNCMSDSCTEQLLRNELNALRNSFPNTSVSTYTYNPLVGVTSVTDPKGISSYYEYDSFERLKFVRDQDLNVLQKYCYNYKGQQVDCTDNSSTGVFIYKSAARSGSFTKSNCPAGGFGTSVPFSQIAGVSTSNTSQAEADALALAIFNTNGKANANANGNCTFYNIAMNATFTKNNCDAGGFGSNVRFGLIAGITSSNISQADADAQALAILNTNGQVNANAKGNCTFYSAAQSGYFTKNNCAAGGSGSAVLYNQGAGVVSSNSSQADADALGMTKFNTDGQAYANAKGICTFYSAAQSGSFTKNNCAVGGVPETVTYNVPTGLYSSTDSQAAADSKAQLEINNKGQAYANANGICTFYSVARSGSFIKDNCTSGGLGSPVNYTQTAGLYTSTVSQADVDLAGLVAFNRDGQHYANTNGTCTTVTYNAVINDYEPQLRKAWIVLSASAANHATTSITVKIKYDYPKINSWATKTVVIPFEAGQASKIYELQLNFISTVEVQSFTVN